MKLKEYIKELQTIAEQYPDLEVGYWKNQVGEFIPTTIEDLDLLNLANPARAEDGEYDSLSVNG